MSAQEDVFGAGPSEEVPFNASRPDIGSQKMAEALLTESNAVVRSLLSDPPRTPSDLAVAVKLMVRIKRWDEVSRWMTAIEKLTIDDATAVQMVEAAGQRTFSQVENAVEELGSSERTLAKKIIEQANRTRFAPELLSNYANQMRDENPSTRLAGYRGIQSTGRFGIAALLSHIMAAGAPQPSPIMCEALVRLDRPAYDAWCVAIQTSHPDAQLNLAKLAYGSRSPRFATGIESLIANANPDDLAWQPLRDAWQASNSDESRRELYRVSVSRLHNALAVYSQTRFDFDAPVSMKWELGADGRTLSVVECRPVDALWSSITHEAENVLRLSVEPNDNAALSLAILAQSAVTPEQKSKLNQRAKAWVDTAEFCCLAFDLAVKHDLPQAQRVILEELADFIIPLQPKARDRLIGALDSGYSSVRYTAASILIDYQLSLKPDEPNGLFGLSKLDRVVRSMAQISSKPKAFVVGGSSSLRSHLKTLLNSRGIDVDDFANAGGVIATARQGDIVDQIYIVSNVFEMSLQQLVQRLRATPAGSKIPIVMMADSLGASAIEFLQQDARLIIGSVPAESDGLQLTLDKLALMAESSAPADAADRFLWVEKAEAYLSAGRPK